MADTPPATGTGTHADLDSRPSADSTRWRWWQDAVFYQIYVRSFADANGDGIGDIAGITSRLPYLAGLGVDAIWLTPFYRSPQADHGYDVADYRDVDDLFGTLDDFDEMLASAHHLGIRVIIDLVPNHSSDEHAWFRAALAAAPGSPERARYIFRDGRGKDGTEPPNNWQSVFGGPAWTRVSDGQWYLHLFDARQPDFDWNNPEVGDEFESILRFWLDRGVNGFRVDVAHGLIKAPGLPDADPALAEGTTGGGIDEAMAERGRPYWDQPGVHEVYRRWHRVLASYDGDRMAVAEAWVDNAEAMARYVRDDELQQAFNFHWLESEWSAAEFRRVVEETFAAVDPVGATPTWVLSNHDVDRHVSRFGGGAVGLARARAATAMMLALPGSAYIYAGEELGLPQVAVPESARQDPTWLRGRGVGRDGCRVPMPWSGDAPPYGFGPDGATPWLPQPDLWAQLSVAAQEHDDDSTLALYQRLLAVRHELLHELGTGVEFISRSDDVLALRRDALVCAVNCGSTSADISDLVDPSTLVLATGAEQQARTGTLAADTAAWFHPGR
ncbi:MAG TPA: alpha-amylase family glycosyl hydrolase [Nocardioidaceae bacterium]|nr:alpha-amylase family glycosyl hydrolase [Nocardioidaceae bacterium]